MQTEQPGHRIESRERQGHTGSNVNKAKRKVVSNGFTVIGAYTYQSSIFAVYLLCLLGFVGYMLDRQGFPAPPVILALVLGPKVEFNLRISLRLSQGDWSILWTRPIAIVLIAATLGVIVLALYRHTRPAGGKPKLGKGISE